MDKGAIITAIVTGIGAFISFFAGKKSERAKTAKIEAEAKKITAEAENIEINNIGKQISIYQKTLVRLEEEVKALTLKLKIQEEKILALQQENKTLHDKLLSMRK